MLEAIAERFKGKRAGAAGNVPKAEDFRNIPRDEWSGMNDKTLAKNLQAYRGAVISEGRSNLNQSTFPEEMARTAAMSRINRDTENHPPFGKSSVDLGKAMEKFPFFPQDDRTMMGNLSRLIEHRNQERSASAKQDQR